MRVKLKLWSDLEVVHFEQVGLSKVLSRNRVVGAPACSISVGVRIGPPGGQVFYYRR